MTARTSRRLGLLVVAVLTAALLAASTTPTAHPARRARHTTPTATPTTSPSPIPPSIPSPITAAAQKYLAGLAAEQQFEGTVLFAVHGRVVLRAGFGDANVTGPLPNTADTRFRIGSLTKAFTALAILQLQQQGHLAVSDALCRYLATCPTAWRSITLTQVLTHSSGIYNYLNLPTFDWSRPHTPAQVVALAAAQPLDFPPGTSYRYSNTGYVLLGMVVERVSGLSYADYVRRHILAPLGMTATDFEPSTDPASGNAVGYHQPAALAATVNQGTVYADGGLASDVDDLYRWDEALLDERSSVATPAMLTEMFRPWVRLVSGHPASLPDYGYGWEVAPDGSEYRHTGGIDGFESLNIMLPHTQTVLIVLSNLDSADLDGIAQHLGAIAGLTL